MALRETAKPILIVTTCVALLQGCSWLFVDAPPAHRAPAGQVACTRSKAAPVIDTVVAAVQVGRTVFAIAQSEADYRDFPISRGADIGLGVGLTALFTASAVYGYATTSACATAQNAAAASLAAPPPLTTAGSEAAAPSPASAPPPSTPVVAPATTRSCRFDAECSGDDTCRDGLCQPP